jgi:hypothetical protein
MAIVTDVVNIIGNTLQTMALTYNGDAFSIDDRKTPAVPQEPKPLSPTSLNLPEFVISVGEQGLWKDITGGNPASPGLRLIDYPCAVTIATPTGNLLAFDNALEDIVQQVRFTMTAQATWVPALAEFNEVNGYGRVPFDRRALSATVNYKIITFTVQTLEPRV